MFLSFTFGVPVKKKNKKKRKKKRTQGVTNYVRKKIEFKKIKIKKNN